MGIKYARGTVSEAVLIRLSPGTDIIEGIEQACRELDITTGVITSCIGSLARSSYCMAAPSLDNDSGVGYSDPSQIEGPLELLSAQGVIGTEEDSGEYFTHLHGILADQYGKLHGGHMMKGTTPVLITCEVMVSKVSGAKMVRTFDPDVGMAVLKPFE